MTWRTLRSSSRPRRRGCAGWRGRARSGARAPGACAAARRRGSRPQLAHQPLQLALMGWRPPGGPGHASASTALTLVPAMPRRPIANRRRQIHPTSSSRLPPRRCWSPTRAAALLPPRGEDGDETAPTTGPRERPARPPPLRYATARVRQPTARALTEPSRRHGRKAPVQRGRRDARHGRGACAPALLGPGPARRWPWQRLPAL